MKVRLIGFRGLGFTKDYKDEDALIRAGHVGWQLEGDKRIFGFHPTKEAIDSVGGEDVAIEWLKEHKTFPKVLGLPIPEETGQLSAYIPQLEALGEPWQGVSE